MYYIYSMCHCVSKHLHVELWPRRDLTSLLALLRANLLIRFCAHFGLWWCLGCLIIVALWGYLIFQSCPFSAHSIRTCLYDAVLLIESRTAYLLCVPCAEVGLGGYNFINWACVHACVCVCVCSQVVIGEEKKHYLAAEFGRKWGEQMLRSDW